MQVQQIFRYFYYYCLFKLTQFLRYLHIIAPLVVKAKVKTDIEIYEDSYKPKFLGTYTGTAVGATEDKIEEYNSNIDPVFYSTKKYTELLKDENNALEKQWRTRILYETTPRGNIALYYDVFKQAFSYYSDQSISYPILNVAAMKYCLAFRCRDFFMDENIIPEGSVSALLELTRAEEIAEIAKNKKTVKEMLPDIKNANFAKFKNYSNKVKDESKDLTKDESKSQYKPNEAEKSINRFLYLGKMINFSFIQKIPQKKVVIKTATRYDNMFGHIDRECVNYKMFKMTQTLETQPLESRPLETQPLESRPLFPESSN